MNAYDKMKAAAMSVWVFINLLCFGMCGYLYLIWSQYWMYIERQRLFNKSSNTPQHTGTVLNSQELYVEKYSSKVPSNSNLSSIRKNRRSAIGAYWGSIGLGQTKTSISPGRTSNNIVRKSQGSPRFPNIHKPILEFDSDRYMCDDYLSSDCESQTHEFKELLLKEFHRVLMADSKVYRSGLDSQNHYDVKYKNDNRKEQSREELLCALKRVSVQTVTAEDEPFARLGFRIPRHPLQDHRVFNTCAVVTNAGSLLGSRLGLYIGKLPTVAVESFLHYSNVKLK